MGELSIKIKIADKEYPMRVNASEEEVIRSAAKLVNDKLQLFKDQYRISDKQDLLAMVAFDSMINQLRSSDVDAGFDNTVSGKVNYLETLISSALED